MADTSRSKLNTWFQNQNHIPLAKADLTKSLILDSAQAKADAKGVTIEVIGASVPETVVADISDFTAYTTLIDCTATVTEVIATTQASTQTPFARESVALTAPGSYSLVYDVVSDVVSTTVLAVGTRIVALDTAVSPLSTLVRVSDGVLLIDESLGAEVSANGSGWTVSVPFDITADGNGAIDVGLSNSASTVFRVIDPTPADKATIENARIILRVT